jgi:predicted RNase H-like HicB family nuclease
MNDTIEIVVTHRSSDVHVALKSNPGIWDCGKTEAEALGNLMKSHSWVFNIRIKRGD